MKKLIVIFIALASFTMLSGCKRMVVHDHRPVVVVDSRHYHKQRTVQVIHHDAAPVRAPMHRRAPPGHTSQHVNNQKQIIVAPRGHDAFSRNRVEQKQQRHRSERSQAPKEHRKGRSDGRPYPRQKKGHARGDNSRVRD